MGICMKTTVDISDALHEAARKAAAAESTTIKALIEEGLRKVLDDRKRNKPFRLRNAAFTGRGLHPDLEGVSWDKIREISYEGRGG